MRVVKTVPRGARMRAKTARRLLRRHRPFATFWGQRVYVSMATDPIAPPEPPLPFCDAPEWTSLGVYMWEREDGTVARISNVSSKAPPDETEPVYGLERTPWDSWSWWDGSFYRDREEIGPIPEQEIRRAMTYHAWMERYVWGTVEDKTGPTAAIHRRMFWPKNVWMEERGNQQVWTFSVKPRYLDNFAVDLAAMVRDLRAQGVRARVWRPQVHR